MAKMCANCGVDYGRTISYQCDRCGSFICYNCGYGRTYCPVCDKGKLIKI